MTLDEAVAKSTFMIGETAADTIVCGWPGSYEVG